jgi:nicotinamide riboside kinase
MQEIKKIVILGPESTGKSTLCKLLAEHYNTIWCPEFAREYLHIHGTAYTYGDLLEIAKGQIALEEEYIKQVNGQWSIVNGESSMVASQWSMVNEEKNETLPSSNEQQPTASQPLTLNLKPSTSNQKHPLLFIDTNMYVMKVWCEFVFGKCHQYILDKISERKYDLYLLCNVDLPWVSDELREYPTYETRQQLYNIYKQLMMHQPVEWIDIQGSYNERLKIAVNAVDSLRT